jgi:hypothetical protein
MHELEENQEITFVFVPSKGKTKDGTCGKCCFDVGQKLESLCPEIACTHDTRKDHKDGYYICAVKDNV